MFSTKLIALVAALMAQEAVALNAHRHAHNDFHDKRAVVYVEDVVTVIDWTTVTVYDDGAPAPTSAPKKIYKENHTLASTGFSSSANSTSSTVTSSSFSTSSSSFSSFSSSSTFSSSLSTSSTSSSLLKTLSLTPIYTPTTLATSTKVSSSYPVATPSTIAVVSSSSSSTPTPTVNGFNSFTSAAGAAISSVVAVITSAVAIPAATTTSSAAATPTTAAGSSSGGSGKRGLAYNDGSLLSVFLNSGSKVSWSYNWGQKAASDATSDVEFVPMLWSPNDASSWPDAVETAISSGSTALLSFNEPDNSGQCNLDAVSAAAAHITHMNPYSGKIKIGAPAITNSGNAGEGINWLTSFLSACDGQCAIDFCPLHWYNVPDADEFLEHVSKVHAACGKPVWITEFAPISGSDSDIASFLQTVMAALDSDEYSYVERYSYFMAATGSMLTSATSLSTYGETFAYY